MHSPVIVNVRGNSGSGKTTLTREFMATGKTFRRLTGRKVTGYDLLTKATKRPWVVLGSYENTCGGCDKIRTQADIIERITKGVAEDRNVWFEGLLTSTMYGAVGKFSEKFADRWLWVFLTPPLEVCLKRIQARRDAAGNTKPFNPANTIARERAILSAKAKIEAAGRRTLTPPGEDTLQAVLYELKRMEA